MVVIYANNIPKGINDHGRIFQKYSSWSHLLLEDMTSSNPITSSKKDFRYGKTTPAAYSFAATDRQVFIAEVGF